MLPKKLPCPENLIIVPSSSDNNLCCDVINEDLELSEIESWKWNEHLRRRKFRDSVSVSVSISVRSDPGLEKNCCRDFVFEGKRWRCFFAQSVHFKLDLPQAARLSIF